MEENDWTCFLFMVGRQSVQLKVEIVFFSISPPFFGLINACVCPRVHACVFWIDRAEHRALAVPSYQWGPAMPPSHSASHSVNGEQNSGENPFHSQTRACTYSAHRSAHTHKCAWEWTAHKMDKKPNVARSQFGISLVWIMLLCPK